MKSADNPGDALAKDMANPAAASKGLAPALFRLLMWNEVVCRGDFVAGDHQGFELWEGPAGFRAGSFLKPIYRRAGDHSSAPRR